MSYIIRLMKAVSLQQTPVNHQLNIIYLWIYTYLSIDRYGNSVSPPPQKILLLFFWFSLLFVSRSFSQGFTPPSLLLYSLVLCLWVSAPDTGLRAPSSDVACWIKGKSERQVRRRHSDGDQALECPPKFETISKFCRSLFPLIAAIAFLKSFKIHNHENMHTHIKYFVLS